MMTQKSREMGMLETMICAVCGSVLSVAVLAMIGFVGISLYSGTTIASATAFLFG